MTSLARRIGFGGAGDATGEDPFDVVADGPNLRVQGDLVRAKRLLRGVDGHGTQVRPESSCASAEFPTGLALRVHARARVAEILRATMVRAGVSCADVGAALDVSERRVSEMRTGARPLEAAHVLVLCERLPALREQLLALLDTRMRGEASR